MKKNEILDSIKALITTVKAAFAEETQTETATTEEAKAEDSAQTSEQAEEKPTENQSTEQVEEKKEEIALGEQAPDMATMQNEINDLRKQVSAMQELQYLREEYDRLKSQMSLMQTNFSEAFEKTLALVEQIADEPTGEAAQTPKNTIANTFKKKDRFSAIEKFTGKN
jgi:hypothetical protein